MKRIKISLYNTIGLRHSSMLKYIMSWHQDAFLYASTVKHCKTSCARKDTR